MVKRPYKASWSNHEAFVWLRRMAMSKFDEDCVEAVIFNAKKVDEIQAQFRDADKEPASGEQVDAKVRIARQGASLSAGFTLCIIESQLQNRNKHSRKDLPKSRVGRARGLIGSGGVACMGAGQSSRIDPSSVPWGHKDHYRKALGTHPRGTPQGNRMNAIVVDPWK